MLAYLIYKAVGLIGVVHCACNPYASCTTPMQTLSMRSQMVMAFRMAAR